MINRTNYDDSFNSSAPFAVADETMNGQPPSENRNENDKARTHETNLSRHSSIHSASLQGLSKSAGSVSRMSNGTANSISNGRPTSTPNNNNNSNSGGSSVAAGVSQTNGVATPTTPTATLTNGNAPLKTTASTPAAGAPPPPADGLAKWREEIARIDHTTRVTAIDACLKTRGFANAQIYARLANMPFHADFSHLKSGAKKTFDSAAAVFSQRVSSSRVESMEHQRAGSGQKRSGNARLDSSDLLAPAADGNERRPAPTALHEDDEPIVPGARRATAADAPLKRTHRHHKRRLTPAAMTSDADDEVFVKENRHNFHSYSYYPAPAPPRHPIDPQGARRSGLNAFDGVYYRPVSDQQYYEKKRTELMLEDISNTARFVRLSDRELRKELEEIEKQKRDREVVDRCMRKHYSISSCYHSFRPPLMPLFRCRASYDETTQRQRAATVHADANDAPPVFEEEEDSADLRVEPPPPASLSAPRRRVASADQLHQQPFLTASGKSNHRTFSIPANLQTLLYFVKTNYPKLFSLMKSLVDRDSKLENLAEDFLDEAEKRLFLLEKRLLRLESSLKHSMGARRKRLQHELHEARKEVREHRSIVDKLQAELEKNEANNEPGTLTHPSACRRHSPAPHPTDSGGNNPKQLNAIRILQRVFGR